MKKTFKTFALMLLAAVAFSSCVDVPTPYNLPSKGDNGSGTEYVFSQSFASSLGDFTSHSETGTLSWKIDYSSAVVTGYGDWNGTGTKSNQAGVTYLVSPEIDLSGIDNAYVVINQAINYAKNTMTDDHHLLIRQAGTESWTDLSMDFNGLGSSFTFVSQNVQLPQSYLGMKIQLALKHIAHESYSSTWEVKSIMVAKGTVPDANSGNDDSGTETSAITCAKALEIINSLSDGAASTETYAVTGYIVESFTNSGKLCFWMSDTKDGEKIIQAYNASLPQGVTAFQVGMKVTATGKLKKYVNKNTGAGTPEVENPTVVILENVDGGGDGGNQGGTVEHITIAEFLAKADVNTTYELTGTVSNIVNTTYGNFDLVEGDASIFIYGLLDLDGNKQKFSTLGISEGDEVTLTGKYKLYNNKAEIADAQFVSVKKGSGDGGQGGDEGGDEGGETVTSLVNGDFESWVSDSEAEGWKSKCTASSSVVSKSSDSHDGDYACKITAANTVNPSKPANQRLATQEITLEAGTYTFSYYAKATTDDICQTRPGYVPVNADGSVGSYMYKDNQGTQIYVDINNNEWTLASIEFTLEKKTTLCLVIMNPKTTEGKSVSQDILVDDAKLEKKE